MIKLKSIADGIPNYGYILFALFSLLSFLVIYLFNLNDKALDTTSIIFLYSAAGLIIKNSNFHKSKFYRFFLLSISLILIGALFKILRLSYSNELMIIAFSFSIASYFLYFIKKRNKKILDYFKVLYFTSFILLKIIKINHFLYFNEIWFFNFISTIIVIILIYFKHNKTPNWFSQ